MKILSRYFLLFVFCAAVFQGCDDVAPAASGKYEEGAFIVSEGSFGAGNGSITYYGADGIAEQNIFKNSDGDFAGDVVQSLTFNNKNAYLVINGDNKIEIVDGNTFAATKTITDAQVDKPRYVEIIDNKAYISVWGAYDENFSLTDSYVLVYDLNTSAFIKKIDTDEGTENLLYAGQHLFAANYNYGSSSTVSVIRPSDNSFVKNIEVSSGPSGMVLDANGKLWVVCVGSYGAEVGHLYRINPSTLEVEDEITITGVPGADIAVSNNKQEILYTVGASLYSIAISATAEPEEPLFEAEDVVSLYAMNVEPSTGNIWIGDAPSFTGIGKVYVYKPDGVKVTSFDTGIIPTQIVFK